MPKARADQSLVEGGLVESRARAQALILAGHVFSGESKIEKAGQALDQQAPLEVRGRDHPWVSRGGIKLAHGLNHFGWIQDVKIDGRSHMTRLLERLEHETGDGFDNGATHRRYPTARRDPRRCLL